MHSPVLLMIFNRPEHTARMVECVRRARPPRLYVAADGPRPDKAGEADLCRRAREAALSIDWPCKVETLFRERNLGCGAACHRALTWFFSRESEGVILEDDMLAHPDFFSFCDAMLERYRSDGRVMHVNGHNFQLGLRRGGASYYFSRFAHVWGWASWARAWEHYDWQMTELEEFMREEFARRVGTPAMAASLLPELRRVSRGLIDSWAWRWTYSLWKAGGMAVMPNHCLTRNIGFGSGVHCLTPSLWDHMRLAPMPKISHPAVMAPCLEADELTVRLCFTPDGLHPQSLFAEAGRRIESGRPEANHELLRLMREGYEDNVHVARLEIYTLAAEGRFEEARVFLAKAMRQWQKAEERALLADVADRIPG